VISKILRHKIHPPATHSVATAQLTLQVIYVIYDRFHACSTYMLSVYRPTTHEYRP